MSSLSFGSRLPALVPEPPEGYLTALAHGPVIQQVKDAIHTAFPDRQWRERKLPPDLTFWFVLGLTLWRSEPLEAVYEKLRQAWGWLACVRDDALAHARERLGTEPFRVFFREVARRAVAAPSLFGLRVYAVDGVHLDAPDTPANAKAYRRPSSRGPGRAFPQVLLITLTDAMTRKIRDFVQVPCRTDERRPAVQLLKGLGAGDLLLLDSGFYAAWFVKELTQRGISYIIRLPSSVKNTKPIEGKPAWFEIETRYLAERRKRKRRGHSITLRIQGRIVTYKVGREKARLITNLSAPSAREIVDAYRLRWETELLNDELKTHLSAAANGTCPLTLRSRSPELVDQEIFALLATYNLLRGQIALAAKQAGVTPLRMSFMGCVRVIRDACINAAPQEIQEAKGAWIVMILKMSRCVLTRPRRHRVCRRATRGHGLRFPGKRPRDRSRPFDFESQLRILGGD